MAKNPFKDFYLIFYPNITFSLLKKSFHNVKKFKKPLLNEQFLS